ncbi:MAG TPA: DMT family transporter, partial [Pararhizobium sp.]|nr:DMT family transporter [Pararhizobium sp.]
MRRTSANLLLLLAGAVWGMGFVAQSTAMDAVGPLLFLALRFLIATAALAPLAWFETRKARTPVGSRSLAGFAACGMALFAGMMAQQYGLLTTSVTNSGFLTGLYVVFTPVLTVLWTRRAPHPVIWPAALSALFGIWLLSGGALVSLKPGDMLTMLCAVLFAFQVILIGIYAPASGRPLTLSLVQFAVCGALGTIAAVLLEPVRWAAISAALPEIL